jgi:glutathione synthase/RimK-type ligase-like ATP-grasp enzyme
MTILILGAGDDEHAVHMRDALRTRGADAIHIDAAAFPTSMTISFDPVDQTGEIVSTCGRQIAFDTISAVYWRNYDGVAPSELPDERQALIAENDSRSLLESILIGLPARWVNGWHAIQLHQTKPVQLAMIARLGVPIPRSVITNAASPLKSFAQRHQRSIFKPVQGGAHTERLTAAQLTPANLASLKIAPISVQEEIPGTNIRAFVAGERVLACEVATSAVDFREDDEPEITPHALSSEQQETCRAIARTLGLVWTGIDFRLTPDGRYVFLEANPSPMFMGFEEYSGLPLTESLADLLLGEKSAARA